MPKKATMLSLAVDLSLPPLRSPLLAIDDTHLEEKPLLTVSMPDMHGNALLFLYRLIACGVLDNKMTTHVHSDNTARAQTLYEHIQHIYTRHAALLAQALKTDDKVAADKAKKQLIQDFEDFKALLSQFTVYTHITVRLMGDLLADRGENDIFILLILQHLHLHDLPYEIIFSNHDAMFVNTIKNKLLTTTLTPLNCAMYIGNSQTSYTLFLSLRNLQEFIRLEIISVSALNALADTVYFPKLCLCSYDRDLLQPVLHTHAPTDLFILKEAAHDLGTPYDDKTIEAFFASIDAMNVRFREKLLADENFIQKKMAHALKAFRDDLRKPKDLGGKHYPGAPLISLIWSRIQTVRSVNPLLLSLMNSIGRDTFYWPTEGWRSHLINHHGHAGTTYSVQHSTMHWNSDNSDLGKIPGCYGKLLFTVLTPLAFPAQRIFCAPIRIEKETSLVPIEAVINATNQMVSTTQKEIGTMTEASSQVGIGVQTMFDNAKRLNFVTELSNGKKNFSGIDLSNCDLSYLDLSGCNFSHATLMGANLTSATLFHTSFENAIMDNAIISNIKINKFTNFKSCRCNSFNKKLEFISFEVITSSIYCGTIEDLLESYNRSVERQIAQREEKYSTMVYKTLSFFQPSVIRAADLPALFAAMEIARNNPRSIENDALLFLEEHETFALPLQAP